MLISRFKKPLCHSGSSIIINASIATHKISYKTNNKPTANISLYRYDFHGILGEFYIASYSSLRKRNG